MIILLDRSLSLNGKTSLWTWHTKSYSLTSIPNCLSPPACLVLFLCFPKGSPTVPKDPVLLKSILQASAAWEDLLWPHQTGADNQSILVPTDNIDTCLTCQVGPLRPKKLGKGRILRETSLPSRADGPARLLQPHSNNQSLWLYNCELLKDGQRIWKVEARGIPQIFLKMYWRSWDREKERRGREWSYSLVHSPRYLHSPGWAATNLGSGNWIWISHVVAGTQLLSLQNCLPGSALAGSCSLELGITAWCFYIRHGSLLSSLRFIYFYRKARFTERRCKEKHILATGSFPKLQQWS